MFFILEGEGTLRFGSAEYPVRKGHFICCPCGGPEVAHQLLNTGSGELRYVAVSTTIDTETAAAPPMGTKARNCNHANQVRSIHEVAMA